MSDLQNFTIALNPTGDTGSSFHVKNAPGGEIQRRHLVDRGSTLTVQGDLVQVLHGSLSPTGAPATLVVADFKFTSAETSRRFIQAVIIVRFADEQQNAEYDPEVLDIAPNGHFSMQLREQTEEVKRSANLSAQGGGPIAGVNGSLGLEVTQSRSKQSQTTLTGDIRFEGRTWGDKNAARWILMENPTEQAGIPNFLRVAILLKRKSPKGKFTATIKIKVSTDIVSTLQSLFGSIPEDDPVIFDPDPERDTTSTDFDLDNLGGQDLKKLSDVRITTILGCAVKS
ncbi:MAG: hypothetical protein M1813_009205 [Trichoglossum hirsutum]|jgi:hypothetical protein|nr:MAG: hypothetical protein M1813_009205 [Trichoglossum hirsutum]